jgi:ribosome-associated heat shock protein Hsp15
MGLRIDKWLWAVRLYKTRSQATEACRSGKISIDGMVVKASRDVKIGDEIEVYKSPLQMKVKVKDFLENRVGAKLVELYMIDLTPKEEYEKLLNVKSKNFEYRDRGTGRPTKKERRVIDDFKGNDD